MLVLNSSVLVAALFSRRGASFWLLDRALDGSVPVAVSVALALEYEDVLLRPSHLEKSWASVGQIITILNGFLGQARLVTPIYFLHRPMLQDADDDMVLECAIHAGADTIVTMNQRDFSPDAERVGISIVSPGEAVRRLRHKMD